MNSVSGGVSWRAASANVVSVASAVIRVANAYSMVLRRLAAMAALLRSAVPAHHRGFRRGFPTRQHRHLVAPEQAQPRVIV